MEGLKKERREGRNERKKEGRKQIIDLDNRVVIAWRIGWVEVGEGMGG